MHEYRLAEPSAASARLPLAAGNYSSAAKKASLRLDDWVLCRIYQKNNSNPRSAEREKLEDHRHPQLQQQPSRTTSSAANYTALLDSSDDTFFDGLLASDDSQMQSCRIKSLIPLTAKHSNYRYEAMENSAPSPKRFQASSNSRNSTNSCGGSGAGEEIGCGSSTASIVNLLNLQIPQHLPQQTQLGDGGAVSVFRQPFTLSDINWSG